VREGLAQSDAGTVRRRGHERRALGRPGSGNGPGDGLARSGDDDAGDIHRERNRGHAERRTEGLGGLELASRVRRSSHCRGNNEERVALYRKLGALGRRPTGKRRRRGAWSSSSGGAGASADGGGGGRTRTEENLIVVLRGERRRVESGGVRRSSRGEEELGLRDGSGLLVVHCSVSSSSNSILCMYSLRLKRSRAVSNCLGRL